MRFLQVLKKGTGPAQFDTPHTIVIDGDLVYVGDRENARI
jgi:NHL repeat-containing protein